MRHWGRRVFRNLDYVLLVTVLLLVIFSVMMVTSATLHRPVGGDPYFYTKKQATWAILGFALMVLMVLVDYINFQRWAPYLYAGMLALLGLVLFLGRASHGSQRWLPLGGLDLQPSETGKLLIILCLAALLSRRTTPIRGWAEFVPVLAFVGLPMLLVIRQPDLGTSLVFAGIMLGVLFISGACWQKLALLTGGGLGAVVAAFFLHLRHGLRLPLLPHQISRLVVFLDPQVDPLGTGYHLRQSLIAVGAGNIWGQGLFSGSQNQLKFLPEQHTDFIFAVIGEELGLVGVGVLLLLYLILLVRAVRIAGEARETYGTLVAGGVAAMIAFHVLVNVGMAMGVMPITGLPLPFMSYGGNNLILNFAAVGLLESIRLRRHGIFF
ncbi:MAG: rod shape-determining protein RodA [bacterium]|nr:rod shape-determining protein RodA [bacterium]